MLWSKRPRLSPAFSGWPLLFEYLYIKQLLEIGLNCVLTCAHSQKLTWKSAILLHKLLSSYKCRPDLGFYMSIFEGFKYLETTFLQLTDLRRYQDMCQCKKKIFSFRPPLNHCAAVIRVTIICLHENIILDPIFNW